MRRRTDKDERLMADVPLVFFYLLIIPMDNYEDINQAGISVMATGTSHPNALSFLR